MNEIRDKKLHEILSQNFGYQSFRFEQLNIINSILDKKDTLAIMPTGGGKSLCYQIPALYLEGVTLVISPLISLMQDQVMNLEEYGIPAVFLNSSQNFDEVREAKSKILNGDVKIIYLSPEGILSPKMMSFFDNVNVSLVAIDEAHCVSQWGHEFRSDYTRLGELKERFVNAAFIALTATADAKTRIDIINQLKLENPNIFLSSFDRPNIKYVVLERKEEIKQLDEFISAHHPNDTGIVYCLSRDKVERVAESLLKLGYKAVPYHAGLSANERAMNQEMFNLEEKIIVVATIAFGMGINRPDVRFVAHLDLPKSIEGYYQETGRAGRDGLPSTAWMIFGLNDVVKLSQMLEKTEAHEHYKKVARAKLDSMLALCEAASCRRQYLLSYFGEDSANFCGYCDTCIEAPILEDATINAQKMLSTIYRTNQVFGAGYIIDVIRGSKNNKILERKHDQLSVYGIGKELANEYWSSLLRQLLNLNFIEVKNWEYRSLGLTGKSKNILSGGEKFYIRKQSQAVNVKKVLDKTDSKRTGKRSNISVRDEELFNALKTLRLQISKEKKVPPYVVFNDKSLQDMCDIKPRNDSEFLLVYGVGESKLEAYGEDFLLTIKNYI